MPDSLSVNLPPVAQPKSEGNIVWNRGVWALVLCSSILALIALPISKLLSPGPYAGNWFIDIFGNTGIIMVSATTAITAVFEVIASKKKITALVGVLIILTFLCYIEYGGVTARETPPDITKLAIINLIVFFSMLISGLFVFDFVSDASKKISGIFKKENS
jgi:hypothetical protein